MREIQFRGKDVTTGEWRYGSLVDNLWVYAKSHSWAGQPVCEIISTGECDDYEDMQDKELNRTVIPATVGQFIGIPDKNGKEIYEGDIVEMDGETWQIIWDIDRSGFRFLSILSKKRKFGGTELRIPESVGCQKYLMADMTIIGNIYEHPNLLNPQS